MTQPPEPITRDPDVRGGRPCIAGHPITVAEIALAYEGTGGAWSIDRIAEEFGLTPAEVQAALDYYHAHQSEIDAAIQADQATVERLVETIEAMRDGVARKLAELRTRAKAS